MPNITLATPADLPDLLDMIRALSAFHGDDAPVTLATLKDIFFGPAPTGTALIAKSKGRAVGYAGLTSTMILHDGKLKLEIHHLYVHKAARKKGIGTDLIRSAKAYATSIGATRLTISTDAANTTAIAAYRAINLLEEISGSGPRFRIDLSA